MAYQSLDEWLAWQTTLHAREIELGLDRIEQVAQRLDLLNCPFQVITVAGTNGKGSSVAMLGAILDAAGYTVGSYTSPHILKYNERIKVALNSVTDEELCASFAKIDQARDAISLSFFEFATLAALDIFHQRKVDVAILEVGLGGRLDATNIIDNDLAIVTSIGLDHTEWLGNDKESIAYEKAGILRADKPAVCSDAEPAQSIAHVAEQKKTNLYQLGKDFHYQINASNWDFKTSDGGLTQLPMPNLLGRIQVQNAAGVLMGLQCLQHSLPVPEQAIREGLQRLELAGRFQRVQRDCEVILDVAHNQDSAENLAHNLKAYPSAAKTYAVFAVLNDKDVNSIAELISPYIDAWYIAVVNSARAMKLDSVQQALLKHAGECAIHPFPSVDEAYQSAREKATEKDRVLVFGSIFTVSEVLAQEQLCQQTT